MANLLYAIREAALGIGREGKQGLISIATIASALTVLAGFMLLTGNISLGLDAYRSAGRILSFLSSDADENAVMEEISRTEGVAAIEYHSSEEVLERFREEWGDYADETMDALNENPFQPYIEVSLEEGYDEERLSEALEAVPGVEEVEYGRETMERLERIAGVVSLGTWMIGSVLAFFTFLIVMATIRLSLFSRREEITVLLLIGAPDSFIRAPFLVEGIAVGLLGALVADGLAYLAFIVISGRIPASYFPVVFLPPPSQAGLLILGTALGGLGSLLAVRGFLKAENPRI